MPNFLTSLLVLMGTVLGVTVAFSLQAEYSDVVAEVVDFADPRAVLGLLFGGIGYLVASTIAWDFQRWFEKKLPTLRMRDFLWGAAGLFLGLLIANMTMMPVLVCSSTNTSPTSSTATHSPQSSCQWPSSPCPLPSTCFSATSA